MGISYRVFELFSKDGICLSDRGDDIVLSSIKEGISEYLGTWQGRGGSQA